MLDATGTIVGLTETDITVVETDSEIYVPICARVLAGAALENDVTLRRSVQDITTARSESWNLEHDGH